MPPCPPLVSYKGRRNNQPLYMAFQGNRVGRKVYEIRPDKIKLR